MNSYELSREWFDWCFENPDKVRPIHTSIYFFAIEHCNRLGWKKKFGFPSQMVMEALGIKNWRTYSKALNEVVEFGFIEIIELSKNQYSSNIIAIVNNTKASTKSGTKALDKALSKHGTKQGQSTVSINKQTNKEQLNKEQGTGNRAFDFLKTEYPSRFETDFQMKYGKQIENKEKFVEDFNDTVEQEKLQFDSALFGRLGKYSRNWIENQNKYKKDPHQEKYESTAPKRF